MILAGILALLVIPLLYGTRRPLVEPPARPFCYRCDATFSDVRALGHHVMAAHPPEYQVFRADGSRVEE